MRLRVRVGILRGQELLIGEALEGHHHALGGLVRGIQVGEAGAIRGEFLCALVAEQRAHRDGASHRDCARTHLRALGRPGISAGRHAGDAEQADHRTDRLRACDLVAEIFQMPAGEMPGLVREDADHLVRRFRIEQRTGMDHHAPAAGDERIELAILHQHDFRVARADAGGAKNRRGIVAEQRLDLGVADDGLLAVLRTRYRKERDACRNRQRKRLDMRGSENAGRHDRIPIWQSQIE